MSTAIPSSQAALEDKWENPHRASQSWHILRFESWYMPVGVSFYSLFLCLLTSFLIRSHVCKFKLAPWWSLASSFIGQTPSVNVLETLLDSAFIHKNSLARIIPRICLNADDKPGCWMISREEKWAGFHFRQEGASAFMGNRSYWFGEKSYCNKRGYYGWRHASTVKCLRGSAPFFYSLKMKQDVLVGALLRNVYVYMFPSKLLPNEEKKSFSTNIL